MHRRDFVRKLLTVLAYVASTYFIVVFIQNGIAQYIATSIPFEKSVSEFSFPPGRHIKIGSRPYDITILNANWTFTRMDGVLVSERLFRTNVTANWVNGNWVIEVNTPNKDLIPDEHLKESISKALQATTEEDFWRYLTAYAETALKIDLLPRKEGLFKSIVGSECYLEMESYSVSPILSFRCMRNHQTFFINASIQQLFGRQAIQRISFTRYH